MKWTARILFASLALGVSASTASAAIITLDVNGVFQNGATLSGTLTIDNTLGLATAANLLVGPPTSLAFNVVENQAQIAPTTYQIQTGNAGFSLPDVNITLPVASLVGYTGGSLCSVSNFPAAGCISVTTLFFSPTNAPLLQSGAATTPVPEPATIVLTALGLVGAGVRRRVSKRNS